MLSNNLKRSSALIALLASGAFLGMSGASAAPKVNSGSSINVPVSAFSLDAAEGGGGAIVAPPLTPVEILANTGAVARNAGGAGFLMNLVKTIYQTARVCPECFAW